jgi:hypothetical protein
LAVGGEKGRFGLRIKKPALFCLANEGFYRQQFSKKQNKRRITDPSFANEALTDLTFCFLCAN